MTDKISQEQLRKVQEIEQALHAQAVQRRTYQGQLSEAENALKELAGSEEAYRIVGNLMVRSDARKLTQELEERKAALSARLQSVERQEGQLRQELQRLQQEILGE